MQFFGVNLLSLEQKKKTAQTRYFHLIKNVSFVLISVLVIIALSFGFSRILLDNQAENLQAQIDAELQLRQESKITTINDAVNELNTQIDRVTTIQSNYIQWTDLLADASALIPDGIRLNAVSIDSDDLTYNITGVASTRSTYQTLLDALEDSPLFITVHSPISNLIQRENISFTITGQLDSKQLHGFH